MSEVEWRGRSVPVKIDKARIFLLGLADNEAAIAQVSIAQGYNCFWSFTIGSFDFIVSFLLNLVSFNFFSEGGCFICRSMFPDFKIFF